MGKATSPVVGETRFTDAPPNVDRSLAFGGVIGLPRKR